MSLNYFQSVQDALLKEGDEELDADELALKQVHRAVLLCVLNNTTLDASPVYSEKILLFLLVQPI